MYPFIWKLVKEHNIPKWFEVYNYVTVIPIVIWPVLAFMSIFLFDNPPESQLFILEICVTLVLSYPVWLVLLFRYNFSLYNRKRWLAVSIPALTSTLFFTGFVLIFS